AGSSRRPSPPHRTLRRRTDRSSAGRRAPPHAYLDRTRHGRGSLSRAVRTIVIPARGRRQSPARLAGKLLSRLKSKTMLLADRGYDADWIRASIVSSCRTFREEPLARGLVSSGRDRLPTAPCEARAVRSSAELFRDTS